MKTYTVKLGKPWIRNGRRHEAGTVVTDVTEHEYADLSVLRHRANDEWKENTTKSGTAGQ